MTDSNICLRSVKSQAQNSGLCRITQMADTREIESILSDLYDIESVIPELSSRLAEAVERLSGEVSDSEKDALVSRLYWEVPQIGARNLAKWFFNDSERGRRFRACVLRYMDEFLCEKCGCKLPVTRRDKLRTYTKERGYSLICESCRKSRDAERLSIVSKPIPRNPHPDYRNLETMPYREYLQTPEWQARRKRQLSSAGYRCQVCNTGTKRLNVHHRTYERRGRELFSDLIVLCEDCHALFHGKINTSPS